MAAQGPPGGTASFDENQATRFAIGQLALGKKDGSIVNALVTRGITPDRAQNIVQGARIRRKTAIRRRGKKRIKMGSVAILIGALITGLTYLAASTSAGGGIYIVAFGPILFGAYLLALGLWDMVSH